MFRDSAEAVTKRILQREQTVEDVVCACLNQIERHNAHLGIVFQVSREASIEEARRADRELRGGMVRGPLHGLPITVKDLFDVRGMVSTAGTAGRARHFPARDATVVERLRRAGAIILGKSNAPELGLGYETDNAVYGRSNNPYDVTRTPGGSSGGSAAAVASGMSLLDIGSDGGGSLRVPAHYCGVATIKVTGGRIPGGGHFPPPLSQDVGLVSLGPIARRVSDLRWVLPILAGADVRDPNSLSLPFDDLGSVHVKGLRVGYYLDNGLYDLDPDIRSTVESAATALKELGASVTEVTVPRLGDVEDILLGLLIADRHVVRYWLELAGTTEPFH